MIAHISSFVSGIWQIHAFGEGNTRTTAVFTIQYLRSVGFDINNELFSDHSWYFRNALVRANYKNLLKGIDYSPIYLERFFSEGFIKMYYQDSPRHPRQKYLLTAKGVLVLNSLQ